VIVLLAFVQKNTELGNVQSQGLYDQQTFLRRLKAGDRSQTIASRQQLEKVQGYH
jgi:hypothetical protein